MVRVDNSTILLSAVLAGWLMGLLSWLIKAARDTISQVVIVWFITSVIGLSHLHRSIVGTVEVVAGLWSSSGIPVRELFRFLLWATLGNALGSGLFVALIQSQPFRQTQRRRPRSGHRGRSRRTRHQRDVRSSEQDE